MTCLDIKSTSIKYLQSCKQNDIGRHQHKLRFGDKIYIAEFVRFSGPAQVHSIKRILISHFVRQKSVIHVCMFFC